MSLFSLVKTVKRWLSHARSLHPASTGSSIISRDLFFPSLSPLQHLQDYNNGGGGIQMMGGKMTFKAAASFIGNEVEEEPDIGAWEGNIYYGGEGGAIHASPGYSDDDGEMGLVFEGPVLFRGNKAYVRCMRGWVGWGGRPCVEFKTQACVQQQ